MLDREIRHGEDPQEVVVSHLLEAGQEALEELHVGLIPLGLGVVVNGLEVEEGGRGWRLFHNVSWIKESLERLDALRVIGFGTGAVVLLQMFAFRNRRHGASGRVDEPFKCMYN